MLTTRPLGDPDLVITVKPLLSDPLLVRVIINLPELQKKGQEIFFINMNSTY